MARYTSYRPASRHLGSITYATRHAHEPCKKSRSMYLPFLTRCSAFDQTWIAALSDTRGVQEFGSGHAARPRATMGGTLLSRVSGMNVLSRVPASHARTKPRRRRGGGGMRFYDAGTTRSWVVRVGVVTDPKLRTSVCTFSLFRLSYS